MFFSRFGVKNTFDICRNNNNLRASKSVLYRRNRVRWHQPRVDIEFGQIRGYVVLYNIKETDKFTQRPYAFLLLLVAEALSLPIVLHVRGILFAPMLLAIPALLSIGRVFGHFLAMVVGAPSPLTAGSLTNFLVRMVGRRMKALSAVGTRFFRHPFRLAGCP
jgi:hypothetical protein